MNETQELENEPHPQKAALYLIAPPPDPAMETGFVMVFDQNTGCDGDLITIIHTTEQQCYDELAGYLTDYIGFKPDSSVGIDSKSVVEAYLEEHPVQRMEINKVF
jgi:hypothetical protein